MFSHHAALLATIDQAAQKLQRGLKIHPRVGDGVYLATGSIFAELVSNTTNEPGDVSIEIGTMDAGGGVTIKLSAEKVFGRHCGVLGATGGGESWTIATLLQQIKAVGGRAILFDPTGEFADIPAVSKHYTFNQVEGTAQLVYFPYQSMTEDDLFSLVRPSGQSQGPKLRDAITSLKLVTAAAGTAIAGVSVTAAGLVEKSQKPRAAFFTALDKYKQEINSPFCTLDIFNLPDQIQNECVWSNAKNNAGNWGGAEKTP
jgi:DNA helicase HerA-like ATPase